MERKTFIGIDVSSAKLDICVLAEEKVSVVIDNQVKDIAKFFRSFNSEEVIVAMENTGRYNWALYEVLANIACQVYVLSPLHLKKSLGLVRGKNDKIDAIRIAGFIEKNYRELPRWQPVPKSIQQLKIWLTERSSRVRMKAQLLKQQADYSKMNSLGMDKELLKLNEQMVKNIDKQIAIVEDKINLLIESDSQLKQQAELVRSVPGVGKVLCWFMLAKTNGFTSIDEARKMACYAGVVPFDYQSGSSIRGKHRVSVYADRSLKSLLHLSAMSAIRLNNDLRIYYQRKVAEGKNKMSVLNAVRNKIVHRIYAVIKNQTSYSLVLS